ncbi:hypothetical protein CRUP_022221, partial [Coryphaenoides rupestris]
MGAEVAVGAAVAALPMLQVHVVLQQGRQEEGQGAHLTATDQADEAVGSEVEELGEDRLLLLKECQAALVSTGCAVVEVNGAVGVARPGRAGGSLSQLLEALGLGKWCFFIRLRAVVGEEVHIEFGEVFAGRDSDIMDRDSIATDQADEAVGSEVEELGEDRLLLLKECQAALVSTGCAVVEVNGAVGVARPGRAGGSLSQLLEALGLGKWCFFIRLRAVVGEEVHIEFGEVFAGRDSDIMDRDSIALRCLDDVDTQEVNREEVTRVLTRMFLSVSQEVPSQPSWRESLASLAHKARHALLPRRYTRREAKSRQSLMWARTPPPDSPPRLVDSPVSQSGRSTVSSDDAGGLPVATQEVQTHSELDTVLVKDVKDLQRDRWLLEQELQVLRVAVQSEQGILEDRCSEMEVSMETLRQHNVQLQKMLAQALESPYRAETAAQHRGEEEEDEEERGEEEERGAVEYREEEEEEEKEEQEEESEEVLMGEEEAERKETDFDTKTSSPTSQWVVTSQYLSDSSEDAESVFDEHVGDSIKMMDLVNEEFETHALHSGPIREMSAEAEHYGTCSQEEVADEEECLLLELVKKTKSALCQNKHTHTHTHFQEHTHTDTLSQEHTHPGSGAGADLEVTREKTQGAVMKIRLLEAAEGAPSRGLQRAFRAWDFPMVSGPPTRRAAGSYQRTGRRLYLTLDPSASNGRLLFRQRLVAWLVGVASWAWAGLGEHSRRSTEVLGCKGVYPSHHSHLFSGK